jgi:hypothetical protein
MYANSTNLKILVSKNKIMFSFLNPLSDLMWYISFIIFPLNKINTNVHFWGWYWSFVLRDLQIV